MSARRRFSPRSLAVATAGRLIYQDRRSTPGGQPYVPPQVSWRRFTACCNRALFERGIAPPWIFSAAACEQYWAGRTNNDTSNGPAQYARKPSDIVRFLDSFWSPEVTPTDSVLELGCNSGPNLEALRELGFSNLAGTEINAAAVEEMRRCFPQLAEVAKVEVGSLGAVLRRTPSDSVDVILSVAVLQHIHPRQEQTLAEIVRVARRFVCVIELEWVTLPYLFARDYGRVFQHLGARQVRSHVISAHSLPGAGLPEHIGYVARLLAVPSTTVR